MVLGLPPEVIMAGLFVAGIALVIRSVETFIEAVTRSAVSLGISGFFLAVVLAGVDLENAVLGVAAAVGELPDLALGTVFGEAIFVLAVAVGLAGVAVPFETDVPRTYLLLTVVAPVPMFALSAGGTLSSVAGGVLVALFFPLLAAVYLLETRTAARYMAPEEVEGIIAFDDGAGDDSFDGDRQRGWYQLGVAVVATVGMTAGSALAVIGADGILTAFGISGLAFGATVMSFIASLEELFLTVEPVRQGRPRIAVGNVVGSTLFYRRSRRMPRGRTEIEDFRDDERATLSRTT